MAARATRVAVVQMNSTPDVPRNLAAAERLTGVAVGRGAELVVLPEGFAYLGPDRGRVELAEPLPGGGPILRSCVALAKRAGCELVLGGFPERSSAPGKARNACVHLDRTGAILSIYRKIHLFDVDLPDGTTITESVSTEPGQEIVVSPAAFGGLGLSVCYDVRFPALYQRLVDGGAVAMAVPSAFTATTGKDHWHVLLRARAIETQSYVLAAAQIGHHFDRRRSYGHALIIDPWGTIITECRETEEVAIATVDPQIVERVRRQVPLRRAITS